ncbi:beta-amyrin 28-oxidase-like protein [Tanacetum coccineum]
MCCFKTKFHSDGTFKKVQKARLVAIGVVDSKWVSILMRPLVPVSNLATIRTVSLLLCLFSATVPSRHHRALVFQRSRGCLFAYEIWMTIFSQASSAPCSASTEILDSLPKEGASNYRYQGITSPDLSYAFARQGTLPSKNVYTYMLLLLNTGERPRARLGILNLRDGQRSLFCQTATHNHSSSAEAETRGDANVVAGKEAGVGAWVRMELLSAYQRIAIMLLVVFFLFIALCFFLVYRHNSTTSKNLPPGSFGWPFIGETLAFIRSRRGGTPERFTKERIEKYGSPLVFKTSLLGERMAVFCGAEELGILFNTFLKGLAELPINIPGTRFYRAKRAANAIKKQLIVIIKQRRQALKQEDQSSSFEDLLSHLLLSSDENGRFLSEAEIANNILLLLFAGHDTSAVSITLLMKRLAEHPDVYDNVLKILWSAVTTHKDEDNYPNATKFDPSRFEGAGPNPFTYGGGGDLLIPDEKIEYDPLATPVKGLPVRLHPHQV